MEMIIQGSMEWGIGEKGEMTEGWLLSMGAWWGMGMDGWGMIAQGLLVGLLEASMMARIGLFEFYRRWY